MKNNFFNAMIAHEKANKSNGLKEKKFIKEIKNKIISAVKLGKYSTSLNIKEYGFTNKDVDTIISYILNDADLSTYSHEFIIDVISSDIILEFYW